MALKLFARRLQAFRTGFRLRRLRGALPAVPIDRSVTRNFLICLETGSRQVMLRRHIRQTLGMTVEEYRRRWNLPADYPMVAEAYRSRKESIQSLRKVRSG